MARLGNILKASADEPLDASTLFSMLHQPGASHGDIIEQLDAQKRFLKPEEIINNSLMLDSDYAIMLLQLVEGSDVEIDLSKLRFQLDKIESAEYRIKLLHYLGSINEAKIPLIVARFLDDSNKVVILEALKTLGRLEIDFDVSVLLPYTATMSGIEYEQVMQIISKQADSDLVPHLSGYLSSNNDERNDFFARIVASNADKSNFEKFLRRLMLEDEAIPDVAIANLQKFSNKQLTKVAHELSNHEQPFVRDMAQKLVINLIDDGDLEKIAQFALSDSAQVRERALKSLAKSANRGAISILQKMVDAWPEETIAALRAARQLGFSHGLELALDAIKKQGAEVQRAALETIEAVVSMESAEDVRDNIVLNIGKLDGEVKDSALALMNRLTEEYTLADFQVEEQSGCADLQADYEQISMTTGSTMQSSPLDQLKPGSVWMDRYHIKKEIGRGQMGRVLLVEDDMVDESLIIKFMLPSLTVDQESTERFKREVKYARKISHRNVIRVHDLLIKDGVCAISMEYFESRGLEVILKEKKKGFELRKGLKLLYQVASGMAAAHERGVIHRDLKPSNVLIDKQGHLKIVDFGIASAGSAGESTLTQTGAIVGSPAYLAPERAMGGDVDERCDIYSLGIVAYYVLGGKLPYVGKPMDVIRQHREANAKALADVNPEVPAEVSSLVADMMALEPADRPQTMMAVRDSIRALLGNKA